MAYFHRDGLHFEAVLTHFQTYHTGLAVQGFVLVEDEVAHAVIDLVKNIRNWWKTSGRLSTESRI